MQLAIQGAQQAMETTWLTNSDFADYRSALGLTIANTQGVQSLIAQKLANGYLSQEEYDKILVSVLATREMLQRVTQRESLPGTDATGDPLVIKGDVVVPDIGSASKVAALINQGIKPSVIDVAESDISQTQEINLIGKVA